MVPSGGRGGPSAVRGGLVVLLGSRSARLPQGYEWSAARKELPLIRDEKLLQYKGVVVVLSSEAIRRSFQYPCTGEACL